MEAVSDAHLREIGRISVNFNKLEAFAEFFIWSLLETPIEDAQGVMTQGENFNTLLGKLDRLLPICVQDADLRAKGKTWVGFARSANGLRVDAIHSSWIPRDDESEEAMAFRVTRSGAIMGALLSADQLRHQADLIEQVVQEGRRLLGAIKPETAPDLV